MIKKIAQLLASQLLFFFLSVDQTHKNIFQYQKGPPSPFSCSSHFMSFQCISNLFCCITFSFLAGEDAPGNQASTLLWVVSIYLELSQTSMSIFLAYFGIKRLVYQNTSARTLNLTICTNLLSFMIPLAFTAVTVLDKNIVYLSAWISHSC